MGNQFTKLIMLRMNLLKCFYFETRNGSVTYFVLSFISSLRLISLFSPSVIVLLISTYSVWFNFNSLLYLLSDQKRRPASQIKLAFLTFFTCSPYVKSLFIILPLIFICFPHPPPPLSISSWIVSKWRHFISKYIFHVTISLFIHLSLYSCWSCGCTEHEVHPHWTLTYLIYSFEELI